MFVVYATLFNAGIVSLCPSMKDKARLEVLKKSLDE